MNEADTPPQKSHNSLEPHRGTLILVLDILSLVMCGFFTGIPAWIMGRNDLRKIKDGLMDPTGSRSMTNGGMICGIICCVISLLSIIGIALLIFIGIGVEAANM